MTARPAPYPKFHNSHLWRNVTQMMAARVRRIVVARDAVAVFAAEDWGERHPSEASAGDVVNMTDDELVQVAFTVIDAQVGYWNHTAQLSKLPFALYEIWQVSDEAITLGRI